MHSQADGSRQWGVGVQEEASGAGLAVRMVHLGGPDGGGGGLPPSAALWELRGEPARGAARVGVGGLVTFSRAYTLRHVATDSFLCEERPGHPDGGLGVCRSVADPSALFFLRPTAAGAHRADDAAGMAGASVEASGQSPPLE